MFAAVAACSLTLPRAARAETLTAEQAVSRAASQNPTLRAALLEAAAARHAVDAEEGARQPTLVASVNGEYTETMGTQAGVSTRTESKSVGSSVALRYTTDIGTQLEVGASADSTWRSTIPGSAGTSAALGPTYSALGYVTARQPLLRGAGTDSALAPLAQARSSAVAAEKQQELTASQTALDVLNAYWELWYADQAVAVQEEALTIAQQQLADAKARAELGTGSKLDVLQFQTSVASIADALSQARATRGTRALALGRALDMTPAESASLRAAGAPPAPGAVPSASAVERAVAERSRELLAQRAELEATRSRVASAEDADQPRLDVFATASAGTLWAPSGGTVSLIGGRPAYSIVGGLELELPLGGGRAGADAARARAQLAAAEARYRASVNAIKAEVGSLQVQLAAAGDQVELATQTARMAAELAEAERQRLLLGTTTSSEVVKAEQTRREAELRKLRAVVSQLSSRFQLEHAMGSLLDRFASTRVGRSS